MAVTLNASTASGLIATSDTSGNIELQANGTTKATVSSAGVSFAAQPLIGGVAPPAFSAYSGTTQTGVASGTFTKVLFDTEEFDTANCFSSSRFTPNVAGYYQVTGRTDWSITSGACFVQVYKNGTNYKSGSLNDATPNGVAPTVTCLVYLNGSSDYVELYTYQNNGTNSIFGSSAGTYFQASMVRGA
jgi:hypothetical protein